ncbi:sigma-70 family RNA polymerase sigma factor [Floridanema aerugineum]
MRYYAIINGVSMRPRQNIIELFATFIQFNADRFNHWVTEPKLRRSMENAIIQLRQTEASETFWVLYWYKCWQSESNNFSKSHLTAYLQESCYWAAEKTSHNFGSNQYTLSDCFQIAIANIDTVLKRYNPTQGFPLKNYASAIFSSTIRNLLRDRQEVNISTIWSLLRRISQKRLVESLQQTGLAEEKIATYVLAWKCFKTLYLPEQATGTRKLPAPDKATWDAIANYYNQQRITQLQPGAIEVNSEILEKWLTNCAKAARNYLYPPVVSLNAAKPGQETDEFIDSLPETATDSLLTEMIVQEELQYRAEQLSGMNAVLRGAIAKLDPEAQSIIKLYYGQNLTQQQIAQQLEIKQYTISRRLTKARESLLLALVQWSQNTLHISLSSNVLKDISIVLEGWLKDTLSNADFSSISELPS